MLITKEEFDIEMNRKNALIDEYKKALDETMEELVEAQKLLKERQAAGGDGGYYIHVPVEAECVSCPKLDLETIKGPATDSVFIHQCKHVGFCKQIRANWAAVQETKESKEKAPE